MTKLNNVEIQLMYENAYNKKQLKKWLYDIFKPLLTEDETFDIESTEPDKRKATTHMLNILSILAERKSVYIDTLIAMLCERDYENNRDYLLGLIFYGVSKGYYKVNKGKSNIQIIAKYTFTPEMQRRIDKFKYLNPMIVEPLPVNGKGNNKGSGYLTVGSDSLILGGVYHNESICTDVLDTLNKTPLTLNQYVIRGIRNEWKDLDKPREKESQRDFEKRVKAFEHYEKGCYLTFAEMVALGNRFYLTHKYDKRGRVYCQGYYISYQSNTFAKAVLELSNKEHITNKVNFYQNI